MFQILGIAMLAVGIYVHVTLKEPSGEKGTIAAITTGFIVLGVIIFVIAFFGCCGAVRENHRMIVTVSIIN